MFWADYTLFQEGTCYVTNNELLPAICLLAIEFSDYCYMYLRVLSFRMWTMKNVVGLLLLMMSSH